MYDLIKIKCYSIRGCIYRVSVSDGQHSKNKLTQKAYNLFDFGLRVKVPITQLKLKCVF